MTERPDPTIKPGRTRLAVASLSLSALAFVGILSSEGYTDRAVIPVPGDRPTNGFGSTFKEDGKPVRMGDTITPVRALQRASAHLSKEESKLRSCIGDVPMYQYEYDAVVSWAYNVGAGAACSSTLMRKLKARDYKGACDEMMKWRFVAGREVRGLTIRREHEREMCLGQSGSAGNSQGSH